MRSRRWLLTLTGSLGPLLLALVWAQTQRSRAGEPASPQGTAGSPAMVLHHHLERVRSRRGEVLWQFLGETVQVLDTGDYLIEHLERGQYFSQGQPDVEFSADRARFESRTRNIAVRGNIKVSVRQGLQFTCDTLFWFEAEGKMVVPRVDTLAWRDPKQPATQAASLQTERLFLWPRQQRIELPDPVTGRHGADTIQAQSASGSLREAWLQLAGPAQVAVMASLAGGGNAAPQRIILGVGQDGTMAFNGRTRGAQVNRQVTVQLPQDQLALGCDQATYSGDPDRRIEASGNLTLRDPLNTVQAPRVTVDTITRRATLTGGVTLVHQGGADGTLQLQAPAMTFWYTPGQRHALASGRVRIVSGTVTGTAAQVTVDLEAQTAVLTGAVVLDYVRPGAAPPGASELERARWQPVRVTCGRMTYGFSPGRRQAVATGSPRFTQADRDGTAQRILFDQDREVVVLDGGVRVRNQRGEQAKAARLTYDLARDEMQIEKPNSAEFYLRER